MRKVQLYERNQPNRFESRYYLPVPMNNMGGRFYIPEEMVSKKGTIELEKLESYLIKNINNNIKKYPHKNQFSNHILIDYVENNYPDRIIYEEDKVIDDWI
mgnify:CR=1 FL=1